MQIIFIRIMRLYVLLCLQSLYTGVYARGGPVAVEPQFDLSTYLDRSAGTDERGVKKSATPKYARQYTSSNSARQMHGCIGACDSATAVPAAM
jgi:hypothetical protein